MYFCDSPGIFALFYQFETFCVSHTPRLSTAYPPHIRRIPMRSTGVTGYAANAVDVRWISGGCAVDKRGLCGGSFSFNRHV